MSRVIFQFKDGSHINIIADAIDLRDGFVMAWNGEGLVAIAKAEEIKSCHISDPSGKEG